MGCWLDCITSNRAAGPGTIAVHAIADWFDNLVGDPPWWSCVDELLVVMVTIRRTSWFQLGVASTVYRAERNDSSQAGKDEDIKVLGDVIVRR
jgi:hypothetical protein